MDSFTHKSPAKINTFLNVLSKRNDGYHNIYTHFELIDIFDVMIKYLFCFSNKSIKV